MLREPYIKQFNKNNRPITAETTLIYIYFMFFCLQMPTLSFIYTAICECVLSLTIQIWSFLSEKFILLACNVLLSKLGKNTSVQLYAVIRTQSRQKEWPFDI